MALTAAAFVTSVRRRGMFPANHARGLLDSDILALANEELRTHLQGLLARVDGERAVAVVDYLVAAGQSHYRLPTIATGDSVRDVQYQEGQDFYPLEYISPERSSWDVTGYYFEGDDVVLTPKPVSGGILRIKVVRTMPLLSEGVATTLVTGASGSTLTTSGAAPSYPGFFDLVTDQGDYMAYGLWLTAGGQHSYALSTTPRDLDPAVVSYLSLPAQARRPTHLVPSDVATHVPLTKSLENILILRTVHAIMGGLGDPRADSVMGRANLLEEKMLATIQPRSRGRAQVVTNRNGPGFSSGTRTYWRR